MFSLSKKTALKRTIFFVLSDIIFIAISVWLAFLIRFDGHIPSQYILFIERMIIIEIIFTVLIFYFLKLYSFSWSYVSTQEAVSLFKGTTISFIFLSITIYVSKYFPHFLNFPRSVIFINYILIFILCAGIRLSKRIYLQNLVIDKFSKKERTLIVGAGDAGEQILRSINSSKDSNYLPVAFVDDSSIKKGINIHGLKVLGKINDIPAIVKSENIKCLIIALPTASSKIIKIAVELGNKAHVKKIKIVPQIQDLMSGTVSLRNLKEVGVEDLLGRDKISLNTKQIEAFLKDKIILVTGSAGSIGSELIKQIAKFNPSLILLLDQDETGIFNIAKELEYIFPKIKVKQIVADVVDENKINEILKNFSPNIVFHAAAYKHVPLMEQNPSEAVKNNILGTEILVKACIKNNVERFVFISTDKAVNPTSVMGATKRAGEMICQAYNQKGKTKFISVRFGNVLNSRGSVIPIFREQIKKGGPVTVTDPEMKRYFMLTSEACLLVMQAGSMGIGGEVFVLDMGKPIKILDLAKDMIRLSGFEPDKDIAIVFSGSRPGEKLFEEMLSAEEGTISTQQNEIFIAKLSNIDSIDLQEKLENLKNVLSYSKTEEIIQNLKILVPFYK